MNLMLHVAQERERRGEKWVPRWFRATPDAKVAALDCRSLDFFGAVCCSPALMCKIRIADASRFAAVSD